MDWSYIINQLGEDRENYFNAIAPPLMQTSNFAFTDVASFREALADEYKGKLYSRGHNPTIDILRKKLAALDGAEDALVFGSGVAAIFSAVFSNISQGDHIVSVAKPYSWTIKLFENLLPKFGVTTTFIDGTKVKNFANAIRPNTAILFLESPNTFTFELQDIKAIAQLAKSKNIVTIIDNSYCSPYYQQPIPMGIDISVQSATKYIGGHSDVVAGVMTGSTEMIKKIFNAEFLNIGGNISPMNAWLLLRGLRTLQVRLDKIEGSTKQIIAFLEKHPKVDKIYYPFHSSFPQYELAKSQMKGAGGLFSILLKAEGVEEIEEFCNKLNSFFIAVSWGGHESLVFPAIAAISREEFDKNNEDHRLIRLYIGLEEPDYLIADLKQALD